MITAELCFERNGVMLYCCYNIACTFPIIPLPRLHCHAATVTLLLLLYCCYYCCCFVRVAVSCNAVMYSNAALYNVLLSYCFDCIVLLCIFYKSYLLQYVFLTFILLLTNEC